MALTKKRALGAAFAVVVAAACTTGLASCSGDDGAGERDAPDGAVDDGGDGDGDGDGDTVDLLRVPATVTGFSTLGEPRSGDGATLSGDGFEHGARRCTANGLFCVTGGFEP